jgi:DNA polymerase elongation subunit (family B)
LKVEPTSKVEVEYDDDSKLVKLTKAEDEDSIPPLPFSILSINVHTLFGKINPEDPIVMIKSRYEEANNPRQAVETLFKSKEENDILEDFCSYVRTKDPDVLIFLGDYYANTVLD